jgi:hypothetical protein
MIEVKMRVNDVPHVLWLNAQFIELRIDDVLALEAVRAEGARRPGPQ